MKFYQIRDPYYALIAANSLEECLSVYEDVVADIDDEELFLNTTEQLSSAKAFAIIADAKTESDAETIGFDEAVSILADAQKADSGELLLVDGDLI